MNVAVSGSTSERDRPVAFDPMIPDYEGACLSRAVPALLRRRENPPPEWVPPVAAAADQIVLLVLDGLGWLQLKDRAALAPALSSLAGGPITSVVPTTTATALTSLVTGTAPGTHGIVGYRIALGSDVLNVLKWSLTAGDGRHAVPPEQFQVQPAFLGRDCPVVSRAEFADSGFTDAHQRGVRLFGWRVASSIAVEVRRQLEAGESFVYAYYDGVDKVAHDTGLGANYDAELRTVDRLVEDLLAALPAGAALVVTADHGQVEVLRPPIVLDSSVTDNVAMFSGEGRFRWLHAKAGTSEALAKRCSEAYGDVAWVVTREEMLEQRWLGPEVGPKVMSRLGDVALVAREPVAFFDPSDTGELRLVARHGSLTPDEMLIPFIAGSSR